MQTLLTASRFALLNVLCLIFIAALLAGGWWIWIAFLGSLFALSAGDELVGDDTKRLPGGGKWFYEANLYASLPILAALTFVALHHFIVTDPTGALHQLSRIGIEFKSARSHHQNSIILGTILGTGYFYSLIGMIVGHELTHRTTSALDMTIGNALLAFAFNTHFAIYHVYAHHRNVATYHDANSARRGEYALSYIFRAMIWSVVEAVEFEATRLRRRGLSVWSWHNRVLSGLSYPIAIVGTVALIGGPRAAAGIAAACVWAQMSDKLQEYVQHYGLVRVPGTPIEPRHSWDCPRLVSNASQYNLARHSDHHINAGKPYWNLELRAGAPVLPFGYQSATLIALVPPLWHAMMNPVLDAWDRQLASPEELDLIKQLGLPSSTSRLKEARTTGL